VPFLWESGECLPLGSCETEADIDVDKCGRRSNGLKSENTRGSSDPNVQTWPMTADVSVFREM